MTVKRVTDMMDIMQIVPIEVRLREKEQSDVPVKDILTFVNAQLLNPYFSIWIATENNRVLAYVITLINAFNTKEIVILRIWYDHHNKEAFRLMVKEMETWAKSNGVQTERIEINRGMKAYIKKWNFNPVSVVMKRRI